MAFNCFINGENYSATAPIFSANDLGLLRGYSMFDYFRTYNGTPFYFDKYWNRFSNSAKILGINIPLERREVENILRELFEQAGESDIAYRFVLTGGNSPDGLSVASPNFLIRAEPLPKENASLRGKGIKVISYDFVRDLPEVKTTNYIHMFIMGEDMKRAEAADLLYQKNGVVSELTRSNFFIFKNDILITPANNILAGITRELVLNLAESDFDVQIRDINLNEIGEADEAFTTSSTKWVLPIRQIDKMVIGKGEGGVRTDYLLKKFEKLTKSWGN